MRKPSRAAPQQHLDGGAAMAASIALSIRLPTIVTSSPASRPRSSSSLSWLITSSHAALGRLGALAQQQRGQDRLAHRAHHPVRELLRRPQLRGAERHGLLGTAQLHQRDDRVQLVGRLVGGRPERLGEPALGVQLPGQRLQLGVIPHGHHGAESAAAPLTASTRSPTRCTRSSCPASEHLRQAQLVQVPPFGVGGQAEQLPRGVVAERQRAVLADQQQPLAYGVQHRVVVLVDAAQLGRAEPVCLPAQPGGHQLGAGGAEGEHDRR